MSLVSELRRRNVLRMAVAYLAGSWLFLQIVETLLAAFAFDDAVLRYFVIALSIGFIPMLAISWAFEWTPEGLQREQDASPKTETAKAQARTWDRVILVVMALALGFFAFDRFVLSPQREAALIATATEAGAEMERAKVSAIAYESVAVLPFTNMSADPANEYFSDGLTETLLHMLAQLADLKVAARTSSFEFKNKNVDIRQIAAKLGVAHVLEGSVQKAANRVRVTAQLIRAEDGFHVWSQNYDRDLDDIFAIQDEIAGHVADALGSTLLGGGNKTIVGVSTNDVPAYDIYLQALEQQAIGSIESLHQAEQLFNEALSRDPVFVDAKIGLVRNNFVKLDSWDIDEFDTDAEVSTRLITEILAANPDDLIGRQHDLMLRSKIAFRAAEVGNYRLLMNELLLLFQEGFGDPFIRRGAVTYLVNEERNDEALELLREGLVSDPLNVDFLLAHAALLYNTDRLDDTNQALLTALQVQPDNPQLYLYLGALEFARKKYADALRYFRKAEVLDPLGTTATAEILLAFNELGLYEHAERWMEIFRSRTTDRIAIINIEVQMASERGDQDTLRRIVPDAMDTILKEGADIPGFLLVEYTNIMLEDNRAQEAINYIESYYPGISDIGDDAKLDWNTMYIQQVVVLPFLQDISDESKYRQDLEAFVAKQREMGLEYVDRDFDSIWRDYMLNGLDAGKTAFFAVFADDTNILWWAWWDFRRSHWTEELRADPEIVAALNAHEDRIAVAREQILEMLQEPEWQE
jgi:TolB-like protein